MNTRERFQAVTQFQPFDRLPLVEYAAWWDLTLERWHREGLPAGLPICAPKGGDVFSGEYRYDIARHFGQDIYLQDWLWANDSECPQPASHGAGLIATMDDYEKILPHLYPDPSRILNREMWSRWAELQKRGEAVLWFTVEGFFWFPRRLFGIEPHLYAFYDEPELMHRINADLAAWILRCFGAICEICTPDFMNFAEDMSYNHGPMLSEELFDEFMLPYYKQVVPSIKERGVIPFMDSDGDITSALSWFERAGIEGILPLERQAGVDVPQLRKDHPRMCFMGHFDKMTMSKGEAAMRAEFERLLPTAAQGGFIIGVDHQTPPGVSYQDYQLYMALYREFAEKAGKLSQ